MAERTLATTCTDNFNNVIGSIPTIFYIPEFVTVAEEEQLLSHVYQAPASKWKSLKNRRLQNWGGAVHEKGLLAQDLPPWLKHITDRIYARSGMFPSAINHVLINEYLPDQGIMLHQDGPAYFPVVAILSLGSPVVMDFSPHPIFKNEMSTKLENTFEDIICEQEGVEMSFGKCLSEYRPFSVALMPRSLLIFKDKAYSDFLHGIKDCAEHRCDEVVNIGNCLDLQFLSGLKPSTDDKEAGTGSVIHRTTARVSLTCRVVKRVHKNLIKL